MNVTIILFESIHNGLDTTPSIPLVCFSQQSVRLLFITQKCSQKGAEGC